MLDPGMVILARLRLCRGVWVCPAHRWLVRGLLTSSSYFKNNRPAGHFKITPRGDFPLTYEQAQPPYRIGVTKGWNSWNATTLRAAGPQHAMQVAVEDSFIRKFILGTWDKMWLSEVVIKRRHNTIIVCGIVCPLPSVKTTHFLIGYAEELLTHMLKCNVKVDVQCVNSKNDLVFKHI